MSRSGSTASPAILEITGGVKTYGEKTALDDVSLRVEAGECLALVGESGSGKTTLLRTFNGMVPLDRGSAGVEGRSVASWDPVELRRRIGYVPQEGGLLPHWTVSKNVGLVPRLRGHSDPEEEAREALRTVGLSPEEFGGRWPRSLSGGQRQRVAIARALAARPGVVLLDEPFGALDAITRAGLQQEFGSLRSTLGFTALLVTHDLREALLLGDRIGVMRGGRLEQVAPGEILKKDPATPYVEALLARAGVESS